jgi:sugar lactone lactonase YvrE
MAETQLRSDYTPETGAIEGPRIFVDLTDCWYTVDNSTGDASGTYWLTMPLVSKVFAFDPTGSQIQEVDMSCHLTNCYGLRGQDHGALYVFSVGYRRSDVVLAGQVAPGGLFAIPCLGTMGLTLPLHAG